MFTCKAVRISLVATAIMALLASSIGFAAGSSTSRSSKSKGYATVRASSTGYKAGSQYGRGSSKKVSNKKSTAYRRGGKSSYSGARYGRGPAKKKYYRRSVVCRPARVTRRATTRTTAQRRAAAAAAARRSAAMRAAGTTAPTGRGPITTPPIGRGPTTPSLESVMANMASAIERRGYSTNLAEAWVMMQQLVRTNGGVKDSGDYRVAYILDVPKGWYVMQDGALTWRAPAAGENQHIEAVIMDALTGQMLPITPTLEVLDATGNSVQSKPLMFLWHPLSNHYGSNYTIPAAGTYSIRITGPAPADIGRHSAKLGARFASPVDVTFTNVQITPKTAPPAEMGPPASGAEAPATEPTP